MHNLEDTEVYELNCSGGYSILKSHPSVEDFVKAFIERLMDFKICSSMYYAGNLYFMKITQFILLSVSVCPKMRKLLYGSFKFVTSDLCQLCK